MQCQTLPVVQKEQGSVWLYAQERARGVPVMDGADAESVADAVFGAHEFRSRQGASQKRMSLTWRASYNGNIFRVFFIFDDGSIVISSRKNRLFFLWRWLFLPLKPRHIKSHLPPMKSSKI